MLFTAFQRDCFWLLSAVLILGSPSRAMAQSEDCGFCYYDDATLSHTMWYSEIEFDYDCTSRPQAFCDGCHWSFEPGDCGFSHYWCGSGGEEEDADPVLAVAFAQAGDEAGLQDLIRNYDNVELNEKRMALQILDCDGAVSAHIPLQPGTYETLLALIPAEG